MRREARPGVAPSLPVAAAVFSVQRFVFSRQYRRMCLVARVLMGAAVLSAVFWAAAAWGGSLPSWGLGCDQCAGGDRVVSAGFRTFGTISGTDVANASQRQWRAGLRVLANGTGDGWCRSKRSPAMVVGTQRTGAGPGRCPAVVVSADLRAGATMVRHRIAASGAQAAAVWAARVGWPSIRCVVGKIQRFQVIKIQGDTLQVKNP